MGKMTAVIRYLVLNNPFYTQLSNCLVITLTKRRGIYVTPQQYVYSVPNESAKV